MTSKAVPHYLQGGIFVPIVIVLQVKQGNSHYGLDNYKVYALRLLQSTAE